MSNEIKQIGTIVSIDRGRNELQKDLTDSCSDILSVTSDSKTRNIAGILLKREQDALKMLDAVVPYEEDSVKDVSKKNKNLFLLSPAATKISACISFCLVIQSAISGNWKYAVLSSGLIAVQSFLMASRQKSKKVKPILETKIDLDKAKKYLTTSESMIRQQVNEIQLMFNAEAVTSTSSLSDTVAEQYVKLYEAHIDRPDNTDIDYALSLSKQLIRKTGLEEVNYSEENSRFFIEEKADFPSQMRYPAIRRKDDGVIVVSGLYVSDIKDIKMGDR